MAPVMYIGGTFIVIFVLVVAVTLFLICLRFPLDVDTFQDVSFSRSLFILHTYFSIFWPCHYRCAYLHCLALIFHFNLLLVAMNGMLYSFSAATRTEVVLIVVFCCLIANATRPFLNVILFHYSIDPRDEPLRRIEIAQYVEEIDAAKAAGIAVHDPRKDGVKPGKNKSDRPQAQQQKKIETTSNSRANLTSAGTSKTSKSTFPSTNHNDFEVDFELDFEDFPQQPVKKPGTAQSTMSRATTSQQSGRRLSAAEAFDVMQSFVFDFEDEIPEAPPLVPAVITDAIATHSFGDFTPIDIGLRDVEDNQPVQVHWLPITVHGLWISVGLLSAISLLALGNIYLTGSLVGEGKCSSEKGAISFGNLLTIVVMMDVFVFQTGFICCVWFFRVMTSSEDDMYWSELHPYDGEWRIYKKQILAMPPLDLEK
jgi:hypothetical protein